jgi:putative DNA primase/helicase
MSFVREWCVVDPQLTITRDQLFMAWERWCMASRTPSGDVRVFGRNLKAAVPRLRDVRLPADQHGHRQWGYAGISLGPDAFVGPTWG